MLEELDLSRNTITDLNRDAFRIMTNLQTIDLSENCLTQLPNYLFFRNVILIKINLNHNHLVALPILMPTQQFVESFNVTDNNFTNMTSFSQYNNIQTLDLSNNQLSFEEMSNDSMDVVKEKDSTESGDAHSHNYLNIRYSTESKYRHHSTSNDATRSPLPRPYNPFDGRSRTRDRLDWSPDVDFIALSRARMDVPSPTTAIGRSTFNQTLEHLLNTLQPNRMSERTFENLIKTTMEENSDQFRVTDLIRVHNIISNYYKNQNREEFTTEMEEIKNNGKFDLASLLQFLQDKIKTRVPRNANLKRPIVSQYTPEQLQQLIQATQTNHLEYFTCRNCSLRSLNFLAKYRELKYVDVGWNKIKTINDQQLLKTLGRLRYLFASDNEIESVNLTAMLHSWPDFCVLNLKRNPRLSCDLISQMQYKVAHLNKMFQLEVNECK